jgi:hypothetical protein
MMVRICDRCHDPIPGAVTFGWVMFGEEQQAGPLLKRDLCLVCLADLREWMDPATYHAEVPR